MKIVYQSYIWLVGFTTFLLIPGSIFAQDLVTPGANNEGRGGGGSFTTPGANTGNGGGSEALQNPLAFKSVEELLVALLNVLIVIATPIVVFFIIFAGFKYVTAQGNAEKVKEATRALTYAVIGGVLIIGAVAISEIIANIVDDFSA